MPRLGRNKLHTELYIEKRFPLFGVRYIAINDHVDTNIGYISGGTQQDEESPSRKSQRNSCRDTPLRKDTPIRGNPTLGRIFHGFTVLVLQKFTKKQAKYTILG